MINSDFQEMINSDFHIVDKGLIDEDRIKYIKKIMSGNHNERLIKYKKRCEEK